MNRLDWQELVDRITSAPAGSRELDVLIHVALFGGNELSQGGAHGSVTVPAVLRGYMGGVEQIRSETVK